MERNHQALCSASLAAKNGEADPHLATKSKSESGQGEAEEKMALTSQT